MFIYEKPQLNSKYVKRLELLVQANAVILTLMHAQPRSRITKSKGRIVTSNVQE